MNFRPLRDRILIKRVDAESKTPGGLVIPDNAKEKPVEGIVVAIGEGARNKDGALIPVGVEVGDRVLFAKYSGSEIKLEGDDHVILREDDLLGVLGQEDGPRASLATLIDEFAKSLRPDQVGNLTNTFDTTQKILFMEILHTAGV